jgi:hypothetical protein
MAAGLSSKASIEATTYSRRTLTTSLGPRDVRLAGPVWAPDPWGSGTPDCRCELYPAGARV